MIASLTPLPVSLPTCHHPTLEWGVRYQGAFHRLDDRTTPPSPPPYPNQSTSFLGFTVHNILRHLHLLLTNPFSPLPSAVLATQCTFYLLISLQTALSFPAAQQVQTKSVILSPSPSYQKHTLHTLANKTENQTAAVFGLSTTFLPVGISFH